MNKADLIKSKQKELNNVTDKLGKKIDDNIFETVLYLNLLGFETTGSCEGHIDWGTLSPWVDLKFNKSKNQIKQGRERQTLFKQIQKLRRNVKNESNKIDGLFEKIDRIDEELEISLLKSSIKIQKILEEFYEKRAPISQRSVIYVHYMYDWMRLQCLGYKFQVINNKSERLNQLIKDQEEWQYFTNFLKTKFKGLLV